MSNLTSNLKRRWQVSRVRPGDGSLLKEHRLWQLFSRSLFHLDLVEEDGSVHRYSADVRIMADARSMQEHEDGTGKPPAALYRDGVQVARANLPTTFPVPGGVIEVGTSMVGVKRIHHVGDDGREQVMWPDPRSTEGRRARLAARRPGFSRALGVVSLVVLLVGLPSVLLEIAASLSQIPPIAENLGSFTTPLDLPVWGTVAVGLVTALASTERATRLRYHWLIDGMQT
jgi:hypothetical protein